ncbi:MAG TPA: hypothetical protein VKF82_06950 [Candidatus Eremiobacteraceae bacterium]|nr:hypothetical protein [Candidatus Eremiobacteraceae bacterium]
MRAGVPTLAVAIVAAAAATIFAYHPFEPLFHQWFFAVACAIVGLLLLAQAVAGLRPRSAEERFAALGGFGGSLLCAAMASAAFAVGQPHMLPGSPGQTTPVRQGASLAVRFPALTEAQMRAGDSPDSVDLLEGSKERPLRAGDERRIGQYVLAASSGPIALVRATTLDGKAVTVTQPQGATFISPYLTFPVSRGDQRLDYFAVPPLHRSVSVAYYQSYRDESKGIVISSPFILLQIAEENGAQLYRGATISGRPVRAAGMILTFTLGHYPVVMLSSAPALVPFALGVLLLGAGLVGYVIVVMGAGLAERPGKKAK